MNKKLGRGAYERWLCITALGAKCKHCGNDDYEVLELDHIRGDGYLNRGVRSSGAEGSCKYWRGSNPTAFRQARLSGRLHEIYQVLCANCHTKKTRQNGEHSRGNKRSRDITDIATPTLPLFEWGEIPSFAEIQLGLPK